MIEANKNHDFGILVISCDAYIDAADVFFDLMEKYWPDCKHPLYFINNSIKREYKNTVLINAGNELDWSERLKKALEQIDEKYLLFMLEDYYIGEKVNSEVIDNAIAIMEKERLKYYRITNTPKGNCKYKNYEFLSAIPDNQRYGINLQAAIWRRDFLLNVLGEKDVSAWEVEINQLKFVKKNFEANIEGCVVDTRNIIDIHNGVIKGKWVPKTINYLKRNGYIINKGNRKILSIRDRITISIKHYGTILIPKYMQKQTKKMISKLGVKFESKY